MPPTIDWSKPIQTRDGREAKFLHDFGNEGTATRQPIFVAVKRLSAWEHCTCERNGDYWEAVVDSHPCDSDLINVPEKRKVKLCMNVYGSGSVLAHLDQACAEFSRSKGCIAYLEREIEYTVGEGLEGEAK